MGLTGGNRRPVCRCLTVVEGTRSEMAESNVFEAPPAGACVLVTGGAGFIGAHLSQALLDEGYRVVGVDCLVPYYDLRIKERRVAELEAAGGSYRFVRQNLADEAPLRALLAEERPAAVVHLAAQAGVRYCEQNPEEAKRNNVEATRLLLELAAAAGSSVGHLLFASSSSIYGHHARPWGEELEPRPAGVYGNSKRQGEEMLAALHASGSAPGLALAAMRFFTVYGPNGRPDMAPAKFLQAVHRGAEVPVYGDGSAVRDFTFVSDIVQGIVRIVRNPRPLEVYNLGKGAVEPASVLDLIRAIEGKLNKKARIEFSGPRAGDVPATQADITKAQKMLGYAPHYTLDEGMAATVRYYLRHVQRIPLVCVFLADEDTEADAVALLTSLQAQSSPTRVVVVHTGGEEQREARAALATAHGATAFLTAAKADAWTAVMQWIDADLLTVPEGETYAAADDPSSLFVAAAVAGDSFDSGHVAACMEAVGDSGCELLASHLSSSSPTAATANAAVASLDTDAWAGAAEGGGSNLFVRLDQLRRVLEASAVAGAAPGALLAAAVPLLHAAGNVRTRAVASCSCSRR